MLWEERQRRPWAVAATEPPAAAGLLGSCPRRAEARRERRPPQEVACLEPLRGTLAEVGWAKLPGR